MTTLTFPLDPLAAAVVARLKTPTNLNVHVGRVTDSDDSAKTISAPLPYVRINAGVGFNTSERLGGRGGGALRFTIGISGITEDQTRAVARAVRGWMNGATLTVDGKTRRVWLDDLEETFIRVDEVWSRPDGGPIYYGLDRYFVR